MSVLFDKGSKQGWVGTKGAMGWERRNVRFDHSHFPGIPVLHCCHPTALRPWYVKHKDGHVQTFFNLKQAQWWVENGGADITSDDAHRNLWEQMLRAVK